MDRREALKKMAAGGATVVGASVVLSNVAFADGGTPRNRGTGIPSTVSVTASGLPNQKSFTSTITVPSGFSCLSPRTTRVDTYLTVISNPNNFLVSNTGTAYTNGRSALTFTVDNGAAFPVPTSTITVRFFARFVCVGATNAWSCYSWDIVYTITNPNNGNNITVTYVGETSRSSAPSGACDAGV